MVRPSKHIDAVFGHTGLAEEGIENLYEKACAIGRDMSCSPSNYDFGLGSFEFRQAQEDMYVICRFLNSLVSASRTDDVQSGRPCNTGECFCTPSIAQEAVDAEIASMQSTIDDLRNTNRRLFNENNDLSKRVETQAADIRATITQRANDYSRHQEELKSLVGHSSTYYRAKIKDMENELERVNGLYINACKLAYSNGKKYQALRDLNTGLINEMKQL